MNDELLDVITVLSFILQIQNYNENLSQNDKADLMHALDHKMNNLLERIEQDIKDQNKKLDAILERLEKIDGH